MQPLIFLALFLSAFPLWAQTPTQTPAQAGWQGVLRDSGGAPIADAKVRLSGNGVKSEATTSADGHFRFAALPDGQYRLLLENKGRKIEFGQPIDVSATSPAALLTLSSRGELSVSVVTGQAGAGVEISSDAVSELPLNGRDFGTLLLLAAGTMTDANGATNFTAQFAINGQRGVEATFAMDGADISDPEMGGSTFANFNVDAVERIDSSSGWMPASVGRGAAGFTNIVTARAPADFMAHFLSLCATQPSMHAITLTTLRPHIPAAFRRFAAMSLGSPTAARSISRMSTMAATARFILCSPRHFARCSELRR